MTIIYEQALQEAKEHLLRWKELGYRLGKTDDPSWSLILAIRQGEVNQIELLIQIANHGS